MTTLAAVAAALILSLALFSCVALLAAVWLSRDEHVTPEHDEW